MEGEHAVLASSLNRAVIAEGKKQRVGGMMTGRGKVSSRADTM